jgi:hypothetical protein
MFAVFGAGFGWIRHVRNGGHGRAKPDGDGGLNCFC